MFFMCIADTNIRVGLEDNLDAVQHTHTHRYHRWYSVANWLLVYRLLCLNVPLERNVDAHKWFTYLLCPAIEHVVIRADKTNKHHSMRICRRISWETHQMRMLNQVSYPTFITAKFSSRRLNNTPSCPVALFHFAEIIFSIYIPCAWYDVIDHFYGPVEIIVSAGCAEKHFLNIY